MIRIRTLILTTCLVGFSIGMIHAGDIGDKSTKSSPSPSIETRNTPSISPPPPDPIKQRFGEDLSDAIKLKESGRLDEAVAARKRILSYATEDYMKLESLRDITNIRLQQNRYDEAAQTLIDAEHSISDPLLSCQILYSASLSKPVRAALADALERAVRGRNDLAVTPLFLADIYQEDKNYERARKIIREVAARPHKDPHVLNLICIRCTQDRELATLGVSVGEVLVKRQPDFAWNWINLAELYSQAGLRYHAVKTASKLVDSPNAEWVTLMRMAGILKQNRYYDKAIEAYRKADAADSQVNTVGSYDIAEVYALQGRYTEALEMYRNLLALSKDQGMIELYNRRITELQLSSAVSDSKTIAKDLISLEENGKTEPVDDTLHNLIADAGDKTRAIHERSVGLSDALSVEITNRDGLPYCKMLLAALYGYVGKLTEAKQIAVELLPKLQSTSMLSELGDICSRNKDYPTALEVRKKAVELAPDNSGAHSELAYSYYATGNKDAAIDEMRTATKLKINDPGALFYIGISFRDFKQDDEAISVFTRAVHLDEENMKAEGTYTEWIQWSCLYAITEIYSSRRDKANTCKYARLIEERVNMNKKYAQNKILETRNW